MDIPTPEEMLATIDAFLARHSSIGESRFGRDASGEPGLVDRLRKGSSPTLNILWRMKRYMAAKDAELDASADHVATDTVETEAVSLGKSDEISGDRVAA